MPSVELWRLPLQNFRIVRDPKMQVEIDGFGMLQAALTQFLCPRWARPSKWIWTESHSVIFPMRKYKAFNTVTKIVPDALLEWSVGSRERPSYGHVFGWQIRAVDDLHMEITNYCDWTDAPEEVRDKFPLIPKAMLEQSVANLAALAAGGGKGPVR